MDIIMGYRGIRINWCETNVQFISMGQNARLCIVACEFLGDPFRIKGDEL